MARITGGIGVPHTPYFPKFAAAQGPEGEINSFFSPIRSRIEAHRPDVLVIIDTDHFNTFYFDNFPTFAVGVDDSFYGPVDDVALMPPRDIGSDKALARHLHTALVRAEFDPAFVTNYKIGHSTCVPLYFLTPELDVPVVPIFLNGHLPPMPSATRAYRFGKALGAAIRAWPADIGVEVIGTGSFSLDVAGPLMFEGELRRSGSGLGQTGHRAHGRGRYGDTHRRGNRTAYAVCGQCGRRGSQLDRHDRSDRKR